eukprot:9010572-Ditylum_brightwellii.AAC.1
MFGTRAIAMTGMVIFWLSFFIPIVHGYRYWRFKESVSRDIKDFVPDAAYKSFNPDKHKYTDYFKSAEYIMEKEGKLPKTKYKIEEMKKFTEYVEAAKT